MALHVAYLTLDPGIPVGGTKGAAVHVEAITAALAAAGHRVTILAARSAEGGRSTCPVEVLGLPEGGRQAVKATADLASHYLPDYRLDRDLRSILLNATLARPLARRLAELGVEVVLERLSLFGAAGLEAARAAGLKHALEMNAPLAEEALRFRGLTVAPLAHALERQVLLGTDLVLPVSRSLEGYCRSLGVPGERIAVVPNGVDLARFTPVGAGEAVRARLSLAADDRVVGLVSGLRPWHGGLDLARAFVNVAAADPRARLLVVGEGPERDLMVDLLARAGCADRARFVGTVAHDEVPAYLEAMDVAVAPYRPAAGFYFSPLKIYEYMAIGRAIVAACLGQIEEVIEDGVSGRLTTPGDLPALSRAILALLADDGLRQKLGTAARRAAEERHAWSRAATRVELRLLGLLEEARTGARTAGAMGWVAAGHEGRGQAPDSVRTAQVARSAAQEVAREVAQEVGREVAAGGTGTCSA
jgi:glycosyltransferase involved in cell wall biosynthesis